MELKRFSKDLLEAKKTSWEKLLQPVLRNEGICWSEVYKHVKRRKGNREIISAIKDHNGTIITDSTGKANFLNSYYEYAAIFCCIYNIPKIKLANSGETFIIYTKIIRKSLAKIGSNKSVEPAEVSSEIRKLEGEAMIHFLTRIL